MYFRNIVLSAFSIAFITGLFLSVYQEFLITPIILDSEVYEVIEPISQQADVTDVTKVWVPEEGTQRSSFSFTANVLVCFAYALLLLSAMAVKPSLKVIRGVFWGGAAYLSIFAAPALGLPPELPGMEAAHLEERQAWWLCTVLLTATGLWLIAFSRKIFKLMGVALLIIPHLLGAPQPEIHGFANTDPQAVTALTSLWHQFIVQTSLANALLWLIMGLLSAFLTNRFIYPLDHKE